MNLIKPFACSKTCAKACVIGENHYLRLLKFRICAHSLDDYRKFLSGLQHLNSPGRLRNLTQGVSEIRRSLRARKLIDELIRLLETLQTLQPLLDYIYQAQVNLPDDADWNQEAERVRRDQLEALRDSKQRNQSALLGRLKGGLSNLQDSYIPAYLKLHQHARLDTTQDARKKRLTSDAKWAQLRSLAQIEFLPGRQLSELELRLSGIRSCPGLTMQICALMPLVHIVDMCHEANKLILPLVN